MFEAFVPSECNSHCHDGITRRLYEALGGWWDIENNPDHLLLIPTCSEVNAVALPTKPIIPQFVAELRRVARFYCETAAFLESHADEIVTGEQKTTRKSGRKGR